ncbi:MAG: cation:proton antiporter [Candidatus Aminicenantes bacterium]|nr:cation:proton antiporter [Candidatus Aminicenantes bacterium]
MIPLLLIFVLMWLFKSPWLAPYTDTGHSSSIALGFVLIFAFLFGKKIQRFKLPQITGFIIAGLICGPYILGFLSKSDVSNLQLLDGLALSLIALTAGGEMRLEKLKSGIKPLMSIILFQTLLIIAGFLGLCFLISPFFSFFSAESIEQTLVTSLLLGVLATATSPSTTIAVMTETRAKGRFTELILNAAVVKDFIVIVLFAFSISFSKNILSEVKEFDFLFLFSILKEIGLSLAVGGIVGGGIILYLKYIRRDMTIFILAVAFFTYQISHRYDLHPLMICLLAGFLVENFSYLGEKLIQAIEKVSLPVFVVFFAISGASINLEALSKTWILALLFVLWRAVLKFSGTYIGARISGENPAIQKNAWAGFISQAGVTLGMAIVIEKAFPDWGKDFKTLVLAIIAINQIIGPVLLQKLLFKVDEAGKKE